jgi:PKD repeat protein
MDNTVIVYKSGSNPASVTDGTVLYNGTSSSTNHGGLNAGNHVYYGAWGWNNTARLFSYDYDTADETTNSPPTQVNENPRNGSTISSLTPALNVTIDDADDDTVTAYWYSNSSGSWTRFAINSSIIITSGPVNIIQTNSNFSSSTTYYWSVNLSDSFGWTNKTYKVSINRRPMFSNPTPNNKSSGVSTSTSTLSITIQDPENDSFNYSIQTSPNIGNTSGNNKHNGSFTCSVSGLGYSTTYYWYVNATDGTSWINETFYFTTRSRGTGGGTGGVTPPSNKAPNADAGGPYTGYVNIPVQLDGSGSSDPDGTIESYDWDFGDGVSGTGEKPVHTYISEGEYTVKLTVTDDEEATGTSSTTITISPLPSKETSNTTIEKINKEYDIDLEKRFYANDTDGDEVLDEFTDPNGLLTFVNVVNISGNTTFLLSSQDNNIPTFFWNSTIDSITPVRHTLGTISKTRVNQEEATITLTIRVNKSGWIYIETADRYPSYPLTIKTYDNRTISSDLIWRKTGTIYVLDDPETEYQFIYKYYILHPIFEPPEGTIFTTSKPTITITYQEPVTITKATFGTHDISEDLTTTDYLAFTFTPPSDLSNDTYTLNVTAKDSEGNTLTSMATYTIHLSEQPEKYEEPPWLLIGIISIVIGIIIIIFILFTKG